MARNLLNTLLILGLLSFGACKPESYNYEIQNKTGDVKVLMEASRMSPLDGFNVNFTVQALDRPEAKLTKEIYVSNLSDETVSVEWGTEYSAIITFKQRDDTEMLFRLTVNENITHLKEIIPEASFH